MIAATINAESIAQRLNEALGLETLESTPAAGRPAPLRVLVLDDDAIDRRAMLKALQRISGIGDVFEASNIKTAIGLLHNQPLELAVLDYNLPDGLGVELIAPALERGVSCIVVTGQGNERVAVEALSAGAADYLVKDVSGEYLNLLAPTIGRICHHRELEQRCNDLFEQVSEALETIRIMRSLLHVCCVCKKIKSGDNRWEPLDAYIADHAKARVSHGYCPTCYENERRQLGMD